MAESNMSQRGEYPPLPDNSRSAVRVAFPQLVEDFEQDPRVSFSKVENKWILEDDDRSEWEYDAKLQKWIPSLDEALLERQRQAYAVPGVSEAEPAQPPQKKRKQNGSAADGLDKSKRSKTAAERKNTAVYVTSLPLDSTVDEVNSVFSKCGVIAEEIDSGKPRIKLYTDEKGDFKGEALIVYFRAESVKLATQMLDDSDFRLGEPGPAGRMRVTEADFSYKKVQDKPGGEKTSGVSKDQKKIIKKTQKLNNKLADWDDDDPSVIEETSSRWDKVVILKSMFTLHELQEDPAAILDIKDDIREECAKLGEVTNVVLFDKEPQGVASVRFTTVEAARACVRLMDGRMFGGQRVEAHIADGTEKFKKTNEKANADDDDEEEGERINQFGNWLEQDA